MSRVDDFESMFFLLLIIFSKEVPELRLAKRLPLPDIFSQALEIKVRLMEADLPSCP